MLTTSQFQLACPCKFGHLVVSRRVNSYTLQIVWIIMPSIGSDDWHKHVSCHASRWFSYEVKVIDAVDRCLNINVWNQMAMIPTGSRNSSFSNDYERAAFALRDL